MRVLAGVVALLLSCCQLSAMAGDRKPCNAVDDTNVLLKSIKGAGDPELPNCPVQQNPLTYDPLAMAEVDFCDSPLAAICYSEHSNKRLRDVRNHEVDVRIQKEALASTANLLGEDSEKFTEADIKKLPLVQRLFATSNYMLALERAMKREYGEATKISFARKDEVVQLLNKAIEDRVSAGEIPYQVASIMKALITKPTPLSLDEFLARTDVNQASKQSAADKFLEHCGAKGLSHNGWADYYEGKSFVFICPGWLYPGLEGDSDAPFNNTLAVLAHEYGHYMDYGDFSALYADYKSCIWKNHRQLLKSKTKLTGDPFIDASLDGLNSTSHMNEIVSDYWAAQTVLQHLKTSPKAKSRAGKLRILREAYSGLCGMGDEGFHPDDDYRIGLILGSDPGIREAMECKKKPPLTQCTLKGAVKKGWRR